MADVKFQVLLFWAAVGFCFLGSSAFIFSFSFKKESWLKYGTICSYLAAIPMLVALALRWIETGHVPSIGRYEVFTIYAAGVLLFYLAAQMWAPGLRIAGTVVLPVVMILIGIGVLGSKEGTVMPKSYFTFWLWIHMLFATLALGGVLVAAGLNLSYLLKNRDEQAGVPGALMSKLPPSALLDYLGYRFTLFAFVMMSIMIASGSVWAYQSWGRYWGWDPIETWSLISWMVYGLYLHLRTFGVRGKSAAWVGLGVIALVVFSFFGAPYLYPTIHDRFVR